MPRLILTQGLPASGKSTWAKKKTAEEEYHRINRDELRSMIFDIGGDGKWSGEKEEYITKAQFAIADALMSLGKNVIVDDTNLNPKVVQKWQDQAKYYGYAFEIQKFEISVEKAIKRDLKRPNSVGEKVIRRMYNQYIRPEFMPPYNNEQYRYDIDKPWAIICDLDGTLALMGDRSPYEPTEQEILEDKLNEQVAEILGHYRVKGYKIFFLSGRTDKYEQATRLWLRKHEIQYDGLAMRKEGDMRKDWIVKKELFDAHIAHKYYVRLVLDDRNQMVEFWRAIGLPCFQVADGDF